MAKRTCWMLVFAAVLLALSIAAACAGGDDDDNDDDGAPNVPHDYDAATNCLASGCHDGQHGGAYNGETIPDACLECHM